ncbi:MAG: sigma 54-interacting transcriptional regulator [Labilithrix sp.]|nr:sigma 54-interacting transcriptional regulator [Labilithrix sp.]MCW5812960.1 sigma 54-interacting transcriptional regulator [Labilithrix sp.]
MSDTLSQTRREDLSTNEGGFIEEPALYVVLEGERVLSSGMRVPLANVDELRIGRGATRSLRAEDGKKAVLEIPDPRMSGKHARIFREDGAWLLEDSGSTNGTFVEGKRAPSALLEEVTVITFGATVVLFDPAERVPDNIKTAAVDAPSLKSRPRGTATLVPAVEQAMPRLVRVAMSKLSILLLGESGSGKEVLAQTIHKLSGRSGPFVAINCGALAPTLVESQLFGHLKGAFSGALKDEPGLVRASSGGTLFLDEIGELPASAQATLLRVLQEKEVLPVGGTKPVPVDLRVVAATLKPIDTHPGFRADLYARIAAFVHRLVPLRERKADIGLVTADILPRIAGERAEKIRLAPDLGTALVQHHFPLNFRELEHILSVGLVTSTEDLLRLESVGEAMKKSRAPEEPERDRPSSRSGGTSLKDTGKHARSAVPKELSEDDLKLKDDLVAALTKTKGNISEISRTMGKTRMQIHRWMKRFGLDPESFRGG